MNLLSQPLQGVLLLALWLTASVAVASTSKPILPEPQKISTHVYAWIGPLEAPNKTNQGFRMNMAFVVGKDAIAVIDTGYTEPMAQEMLEQIKKISNHPVKYAINTNSQPHRFMGSEVFRRAGATIIAHTKSAARMKEQSTVFAGSIETALELPAGSVKSPQAPDKIINDEVKLDLGSVTLVLREFGAAHTPSELVVEIVEDKVVYASDLLVSDRLLAILTEGNIQSWLAGFERLRQFDGAIFIPGHGRPGPLANFEFATHQYLTVLFQHMSKAVDDGVDMQSAIDSLDLSAFSKLANFDELAGRNASRAYLEREAAGF